MAPRKNQAQKIEPASVITIALKACKSSADYYRIAASNTRTDFETAWARLSPDLQQRITDICKDSPPPDLNAIASEIIACGTYSKRSKD